MRGERAKKLLSVKTWVALWAIGMVSYIVIANRAEFSKWEK